MLPYFRLLFLLYLVSWPCRLAAQRSYAGQSVLATGTWYQVGTTEPGVYRITGAALQSIGYTLPINATSLRLFGRSPGNLPESAGGKYSDDLTELAIMVEDGGDGQIQSTDYLLFYSPGPHVWHQGETAQDLRHSINLYSDTAYYYLTVGGAGKRIETFIHPETSTHSVTEYEFRYWHEKDLHNLLSSGKEWLGERFLAESNQPLNLPINFPPLVSGKTARLKSTVVARSVGALSTMDISVNGNTVGTHTVAPVTASSFDLFARENELSVDFLPAASATIQYRFSSSNSSAIGWLNRFALLAECQLSWQGRSFGFRSWQGAGIGKRGRYELSEAREGLKIWKVSNPLAPVAMTTDIAATTLRFTDDQEKAEEYHVFDPTGPLNAPFLIRSVKNQNLHGATSPQYLIVAAPGLLPAAERLAAWHQQHDGLTSLIVPVEQIYHEFSGGCPDPAAIRNFLKMFYDRSQGNNNARPNYLLLLGNASFDPRNRVLTAPAGVPSFQSSFYLDPLSTYVSDDFFGFLDDHEDINGGLQTNLLDICIGRIPATNLQSANDYIDKLIAYHSPDSRGAWRNELSFIADDEDFNLHLQDMEQITALAAQTNDRFLQQKIYLDAYPQESDAAGSRYPQVNQAISDQMQKGTLIWNYSGHGGFRRLADEVILEQSIVDGWQQNGRLPLFVTATCDFAPFDNPAMLSLGEYLLLKPKAGAIALMTTTRLVFAYSNRVMNANYMQAALERLPDGRYRTLGEAARDAKNATYTGSGDIFNNLKFTLLGDPALTLAFPTHQVLTTQINGQPVGGGFDSLKALQEVRVEGVIANREGALLTNFNGWVYPIVFDQPYEKQTLANDPTSLITRFSVQDKAIFRGKAKVTDGVFVFSFFIPRDISYQDGNLRISYYAMDSLSDAQGAFSELKIAGSATAPDDTDGPVIKAGLNDWSFQPGGLVNERPVLLLHLRDSSGINVLGSGFGHDITLVLDGKEDQTYNLNAFFESDPDTYKSGGLRFQLPLLADGSHTLLIKAWDLLNNSAEILLPFRVHSSPKLVIENLGVWPNPSRGRVKFVFAHNQPPGPMGVKIELFSVEGQRVKIINGTIIVSGNRSYMEWDGKNENGFPVLPGTYIYRLILRLPDGRTAIQSRQLIRL